jgi:hypothetical protein
VTCQNLGRIQAAVLRRVPDRIASDYCQEYAATFGGWISSESQIYPSLGQGGAIQFCRRTPFSCAGRRLLGPVPSIWTGRTVASARSGLPTL